MSAPTANTIVVKIGSSSVTTDGAIEQTAIDKLATEVASLCAGGCRVVIVTSGAIAAGLPLLGKERPKPGKDDALLRAASAVGQPSVMRAFELALGAHGRRAGQILLAPTDFMLRRRYLKSRGTLDALLDLGVVPVVNENDAIADDEIRFGDNDRLAALVAHLIDADLLVLLTDTEGLFTADPRTNQDASLIEEIVAIDQQLEDLAGGPGDENATGGMASKLAAAKIATWSGVETVIAHAGRPGVLADAAAAYAGVGAQSNPATGSGVGTRFVARPSRLAARKLWIAFALPAKGQVVVDAGARQALTDRGRSLLPAGVQGVTGTFAPDDAVEVTDPDGVVFAKGQVRWSSADLLTHAGKQTSAIPRELADEVIHRDALVVLPG